MENAAVPTGDRGVAPHHPTHVVGQEVKVEPFHPVDQADPENRNQGNQCHQEGEHNQGGHDQVLAFAGPE